MSEIKKIDEISMGDDNASFYKGRRVLITGGLGFIGSNLAARLVALGADVLLVDSLTPDSGGNLFNIDGIRHAVQVNVSDVRDASRRAAAWRSAASWAT